MTGRLKKTAAVTAVLIAAAALATGCAEKQDPLESFGSGPIETTQTETAAETVTADGNGVAEAENETPQENGKEEAAPGTEQPVEIDGPGAFPYAVLETDDCTVTLKEVVKEEAGNVYMTFDVDNRSEEYDISISSAYIADGGLLTDGVLDEYVAFDSGSEVFVQVTDGLDVAAGAPHTRITVPVTIKQLTPDEDIVLFERILEIYPDGKEKAGDYVPDLDGATTVLDSDGCKVVCCGLEHSEYYGGWVMKLYCENNTENEVLFRSAEAKVNDGSELDPHWGVIVEPGLCTFGEAVWLDIEAAVAGIEDITKADVSIQAVDMSGDDMTVIAEGKASAER